MVIFYSYVSLPEGKLLWSDRQKFLQSLQSARFVLIAYIASGHFIHTATKNPFLLRMITQDLWGMVASILRRVAGWLAGGCWDDFASYDWDHSTENSLRLEAPVRWWGNIIFCAHCLSDIFLTPILLELNRDGPSCWRQSVNFRGPR